MPKGVILPDPTSVAVSNDALRVASLNTLIELKLASGLSAPHRIKDLGYVQQLIETLNLPPEIAELLKPPVRHENIRLWEATRAAGEHNLGPD